MIEKESGYILHQKPFSETSVLLEVFTQNYGRISLIAKGAKRPKSVFKAHLFPFKLLSFSYVGKNELKTLTHVEVKSEEKINYHSSNQAKQWVFGLYLNELIIRFLKKEDPYPEFFSEFDLGMRYLFNSDMASQNVSSYKISHPYFNQIILRAIEIKLLTSIGYGIHFLKISHSHQAIIEAEFYDYEPEKGFTPTQVVSNQLPNNLSGEMLFLMHELDLNHLEAFFQALEKSQIELNLFLREAKKILRQSLDYHLGEKKLYTRELAKLGECK